MDDPARDGMRWLYHLVDRSDVPAGDLASPSLATEGFVHTSFRDEVLASAALYFPAGADLVALPIDPRRVDAPVEVAATPRGPMPHIHGRIPRDALGVPLELEELRGAPDAVTGTRIALVAFEGMTLLDLVGVLDPLSRIASMGFDPTTTCTVVSADEKPWSHHGATLSVSAVRPSLDTFDVVVVAGGIGTRALERDPRVSAWLGAYPANRILASVCTGALLLGAAGRLRGLRATTHPVELHRLAEHGAEAVEARVVDTWPIVTAGGVTCGLDLGLFLVRRLAGESAAKAIARQMRMPGEADGPP